VYCRCWQSGTFPLCDGAHVPHNKETGDNVGPLILSVAKPPSAEAAAAPAPAVVEEVPDNAAVASSDNDSGEKKSIVEKLKSIFQKEDDGLTNKERLKKMGLSVLLSYGFVSNMSYAVMLSLSWYGFSKKVSSCQCFHSLYFTLVSTVCMFL